MRYYILLILFIFFSCASQMKPSGGPIDDKGPILIKVSPNNESIIMGQENSNTKIILEFNETINPISVVNAIKILNFDEFNYKVQGKKITLHPINKWPDFSIIKITISRSVSDVLGNQISQPIQLFYFNSSLNKNKIIEGNITNSNDEIFELGLYKIVNNDYMLIEKLQSNSDGSFKFSYLDEGEYVVLAVQTIIDDINTDITTKKFGFITEDYIDLIKSDTSMVQIHIGFPLEKLFIKSFRQINNHFGYLMLSNGFEEPFILPWKDSIGNTYSKGDSLLIDVILKNRIESYITPQFKIFTNDIIDTIPPDINSHYLKNNKYHVVFNEPLQNWKDTSDIKKINHKINNPTIYYIQDSTINEVSYNFTNPFSIEFEPRFDSQLYITNIADIYYNTIQDTLSLFIEDQIDSLNYMGGSVYGAITYQGFYPVIVKAENLNSEHIYYTYINNKQEFYFLNMHPGFYNFSAYEILGDYDSTQYFPGSWNPFKRAAKFGSYKETLEVRNLWDIKDMEIRLK